MNAAKTLGRLFAATVVSVAVGVLTGAGVASAGVNDYLQDLSNSGIDGPRNDLLTQGYQACNAQLTGETRDTSIARIASSTRLDQSKAAYLYDSALKNLCPK